MTFLELFDPCQHGKGTGLWLPGQDVQSCRMVSPGCSGLPLPPQSISGTSWEKPSWNAKGKAQDLVEKSEEGFSGQRSPARYFVSHEGREISAEREEALSDISGEYRILPAPEPEWHLTVRSKSLPETWKGSRNVLPRFCAPGITLGPS